MFNSSLNNNVTLWGIMPDYSAGIDITSGFVVPSEGFVVIASNRSNDSKNYGYVNGIVFFRNLQAGTNADSASGTVIVSKGDVITYSGAINLHMFYPLKGAK